MKDYLWNSFYLFMLGTNTYLLWYADWGVITAFQILAQSLMLIGMIELLHQAVHGNYFKLRSLNYFFGIVAGLIVGMNYFSYRELHKNHHLYTNTKNDPEQDFYLGESGRLLTLLLIPFIVSKNGQVANTATSTLSPQQKKYYRLNNYLLVLFFIFIAILLYFYPQQIMRIYFVPVLVFYYLEFFVSHSQHFDTPYFDKDRPTPAEQSEVSTDIILPYPIGFLLMFSNYHGTHHRVQATKWYETPGVASNYPETRRWTVWQFIVLWWNKGRRTWHANWRRDSYSEPGEAHE